MAMDLLEWVRCPSERGGWDSGACLWAASFATRTQRSLTCRSDAWSVPPRATLSLSLSSLLTGDSRSLAWSLPQKPNKRKSEIGFTQPFLGIFISVHSLVQRSLFRFSLLASLPPQVWWSLTADVFFPCCVALKPMYECVNRVGKSLSLNGAVERTKEGKNWARTGALRGAATGCDISNAWEIQRESGWEREREQDFNWILQDRGRVKTIHTYLSQF